jgi:hypothetical protein
MSMDQAHVKVSSMDRKDEIARLEDIEARLLVSLWKGTLTRSGHPGLIIRKAI